MFCYVYSTHIIYINELNGFFYIHYVSSSSSSPSNPPKYKMFIKIKTKRNERHCMSINIKVYMKVLEMLNIKCF